MTAGKCIPTRTALTGPIDTRTLLRLKGKTMRVLRKRNILSFILAFVMTVCVLPVLSKEPVMAASAKEEAAYQKIIAMKEKYPEGTKWGNGKEYKGKTACQAFAFMMSDIAYGESAKFYSHNDFGAL